MVESVVKLPPPEQRGKKSLEEAISARRSVRRFRTDSLTLWHLSQLLWAAQGITSGGLRAIPSAGATFPLVVYVLLGQQTVKSVSAGIYSYQPSNHSLKLHLDGDFRRELAGAALGQSFIATCPVTLVICAIFSRTTYRYGKRGELYVHMEAGHLGQNVALQAVALDLATVMIGAFSNDDVVAVLGLKEDCKPLYIIPIGKPA